MGNASLSLPLSARGANIFTVAALFGNLSTPPPSLLAAYPVQLAPPSTIHDIDMIRMLNYLQIC